MPAGNATVLSTISNRVYLTIDLDVRLASNVGKKSNRLCHDGNLQATRKNPPVIVAGLGPGIIPSYWYFM
jgi:hypothetical protein